MSLDDKMRDQNVVYKSGSDKLDDQLLNPAHLLVGKNALKSKEAGKFAK